MRSWTKLLWKLIDLSAGFFVGYNDGIGTSLDPTLKVVLLTTPAAMSGVKTAVFIGKTKHDIIYAMEEGRINLPNYKQKLEHKLNRTLTWPEFNSLTKSTYGALKNLSVPHVVAKDSLKAVVGTSIGYALGYLVAKFS